MAGPSSESHDCMTKWQVLQFALEKDCGISVLERFSKFENKEKAYQKIIEQVICVSEDTVDKVKSVKVQTKMFQRRCTSLASSSRA